MTSAFENLCGTGKLKAEPADPKEFAGLVRSGKARLRDAENGALSLESRLVVASHPWSRAGGMARPFEGS